MAKRNVLMLRLPIDSGPNQAYRTQSTSSRADSASRAVTSTVFALTSARSGTMTLSAFLQHNAPHYKVVHETNDINLWNPPMFGRSIFDGTTGQLDSVRDVLRRKQRAIQSSGAPVYIETSHAFLKSYWNIAPEFFPNSKIFHLIRNPLEVARSEANREQWMIKRRKYPVRFRYRYYRGDDGRRYRQWALTGLEPIYAGFNLDELSLFEFYLIQWIELENRAMTYLDSFDMHDRCLTLHTPHDLNSEQIAAEVLEFVGVEPTDTMWLPGRRNGAPSGYETVLGAEELEQCRRVVEAIPQSYLDIFSYAPYSGQPWVSLLTKQANSATHTRSTEARAAHLPYWAEASA